MLTIVAVLLPLLVQLFFTAAIILATQGKGSFVGLSAMLLGLVAIPITTLVNWLYTRRKPPLPMVNLAARVFYTTLVFPALMLGLYAVAS